MDSYRDYLLKTPCCSDECELIEARPFSTRFTVANTRTFIFMYKCSYLVAYFCLYIIALVSGVKQNGYSMTYPGFPIGWARQP